MKNLEKLLRAENAMMDDIHKEFKQVHQQVIEFNANKLKDKIQRIKDESFDIDATPSITKLDKYVKNAQDILEAYGSFNIRVQHGETKTNQMATSVDTYIELLPRFMQRAWDAYTEAKDVEPNDAKYAAKQFIGSCTAGQRFDYRVPDQVSRLKEARRYLKADPKIISQEEMGHTSLFVQQQSLPIRTKPATFSLAEYVYQLGQPPVPELDAIVDIVTGKLSKDWTRNCSLLINHVQTTPMIRGKDASEYIGLLADGLTQAIGQPYMKGKEKQLKHLAETLQNYKGGFI